MTRLDVVSENCACVDCQKSWHNMLVTHDSHKQESYMYRLHEPLQYWMQYLNSPHNFTCTSRIEKSTSSGLSRTTFFAHWKEQIAQIKGVFFTPLLTQHHTCKFCKLHLFIIEKSKWLPQNIFQGLKKVQYGHLGEVDFDAGQELRSVIF